MPDEPKKATRDPAGAGEQATAIVFFGVLGKYLAGLAVGVPAAIFNENLPQVIQLGTIIVGSAALTYARNRFGAPFASLLKISTMKSAALK